MTTECCVIFNQPSDDNVVKHSLGKNLTASSSYE